MTPPRTLVLLFALVTALAGCGDPGGATPLDGGEPPDAGLAWVEIGTPDPITGLNFEPLEPGGDIPLETFGQGGTHATLAVRCAGLGNRAYIVATLRDPVTGKDVMTAPGARPSLLLCYEDGVCDLSQPLFVMTGGLADPDAKDGLSIEIEVEMYTEDGRRAVGMNHGVLRRQ